MIAMFRSLFLNRSILLQLGVGLVVCQILAHFLTLAAILWRYERPDLLNATSVSVTQAVGFYEILSKASPTDRATLAAAIERSHPWARLAASDPTQLNLSKQQRQNPFFYGLLYARPDLEDKALLVAGGASEPADDRIYLRLDEGYYFTFPADTGERRITFPHIVASLFVAMMMLPLAVLAIWALATLTAPLRRLANSAERFSIDLDPTALPERGAKEVRTLARAFNSMRARIRQLVDSRSRMLAAVSHDLRTPLTRLRLRTEVLADGEDKERMLRDISAMNKMIGHALSYLRDQTTAFSQQRVALSTLVETICSDFIDTGHKVAFQGPRNIVLDCEPDLLTRAISNLVDNAVKFGGGAVVRLGMRSASEAVLYVEDDGPGIPDDEKFFAFEPFSRGDQSRGGFAVEGFGLGLAIAKQIIERHGGQITLHDRKPHGLCVQVTLPMQPPKQVRHPEIAAPGRTRFDAAPSGRQ